MNKDRPVVSTTI